MAIIHAIASTFCAGWDSCIAVRKTSSARKNVYGRGVSVIRLARMYSSDGTGHRARAPGCGNPEIRPRARRLVQSPHRDVLSEEDRPSA
ncbi:hypothetical protein TRIP_B260015 [uncultured Desulfatiglans sp.]|nr:hypothetical protein TRIP_B260015 [uncultured Desulfatiglans sp.]